ncbi:uncharacterized protein [Halyomorpha halys]|uniref:uncharacterized protein n=1 Tax=Halyomorpha halys TaxID=286706 RepID=UPI0006D51502|nr:uncharacterized protein LOC106687362 [Halyomorpha halys]
MSTELEPEEVPTLPKEESVNLNEESSDVFTEFEELSDYLSEEGSLQYSGKSVFSDGTIVTYETPEVSEEEIVVDDDPLLSVPPEHYPDMLFLMGNHFPIAIHAYEHIRSLIRWKKLFPKQQIQILAPGGDYKNGLFFFNVWHGNFYGSAYCHDRKDKSILEQALATSRHLPVPDQYKMCRLTCLNPNSFEAMKVIFSKDKWCTSHDVVLWLPWYCAREMEVHLPNDNVQIRELGLGHIDLINESWEENFPGSRELIDDLFDIHQGLGLFDDEILLSWALVWYHGGLGIIQTVEREKGKGYCRPVVEALTKRMGEHLIDVHLKITRGKRRDLFFFTALGFRYAFKAFTFETQKYLDKKKSQTKLKTSIIKKN